MVQRSDIVALSISSTKQEALNVVKYGYHSRIPIYDGDLDNIVGFVHIKDVIANLEIDFKIPDVMRRMIFIPPAMKVSAVLFRMKSYRVHAAIVVDEFGATAGLVTMTDIVEEILGEINDEHGANDEPIFIKISSNKFEVSGKLEVNDFIKKSGFKIATSDQFKTIGGYILSIAGKIPVAKEKITSPEGIEFFVVDADLKKINTIIISTANYRL